jgi:hypothetical protein
MTKTMNAHPPDVTNHRAAWFRRPAPAGNGHHPESWEQIEPFDIDEAWVGSLPFDSVSHGAFHLPIECVVYVPSTTAESTPIGEAEFRARVDETAEILVDLFGGCRESTARGRYRDHDGNLIVEEVAVVTGYGKVEDYTGKRQQFMEWLIDVKARWGQESIGFEFEGDLWYL